MKPILILFISLLATTKIFGAGGISSGGGGTLPANPINLYEARQIIMDYKKDVRLILYYMDWLHGKTNYHKPYLKKLFAQKPTILDLTETTDIEIRMDGPCYDKFDNPVDGSIFANRKGAICISAFRIAPKLIQERARKEILALILHELSHLKGLDEEDATAFQETALWSFDDTLDMTSQLMLRDLNIFVSSTMKPLRQASEIAHQENFDELLDSLFEASQNMDRLSESILQSPYSLLNLKNNDFLQIQRARVDIAYQYVLAHSNHSSSEKALEIYNQIFAGKKKVTYVEYLKNHMQTYYDGHFGEFEIIRIESGNDLKTELVDINTYLGDLESYILNFENNLSLPPIANPESMAKTNPWSYFEGDYAVTSTICLTDGKSVPPKGLETLKVFMNDEGSWTLQRKFNNLLLTDPVFEGAGDVVSGSSVTVPGNSSQAARIAEMGNLWGQRWQQKTYEISISSQGNIEFLEHFEYHNRDWYSGWSRGENSCKYQLVRI